MGKSKLKEDYIMRRVKKAAALTLAAAMVFSLAGCGRNAGNQTGKAQGAAAGSGENAAGSLEAGSGQVTINFRFPLVLFCFVSKPEQYCVICTK